VREHGTGNVPPQGPVIVAANHTGVIDGPLLAIFGPRPVHALTKREMFEGRLGGFLQASGQIPLDRLATDRSAIRACLHVLARGGAVGIFPEGNRGAGDLTRFRPGAAYLALVTGAPIVPLTMFGTRPAGGGKDALPEPGAVLDLVYGVVSRWTAPSDMTRGETVRVESIRSRASSDDSVAETSEPPSSAARRAARAAASAVR